MAKNGKPPKTTEPPKAAWEIALEKVSAVNAETSANLAKAAVEMAQLRKLIGSYTKDESEILEEQVVAAIIKGGWTLGGVRFDEIIANSHVHSKHGDGEFDWVGINGAVVVVGETKRTLERGDARYFANDRIALFKRASRLAKGRQVQGAVIFQTAKAGAVKEALDLGMMVFRADGKKTLHPITTPADIPAKRAQAKTHKRP